MSRKQFKVAGSTHEKKLSKKDRKTQEGNQVQVPQEELIPTEEDTAQIKNLVLYAVIGITLLLFFMYLTFINSQ
jgi:Fe2+ transport system protein B